MHTVHSMEFQDELETTAEHMVSHNAMCLTLHVHYDEWTRSDVNCNFESNWLKFC